MLQLALQTVLLVAAQDPGASAAVAAPAAVDALPDWKGWRGPDGSGLSEETSWSSELGETLWSVDVGRGYSGVCLTGGILVTIGFDASASKDHVRGLNPISGEELWRYGYAADLEDNMHEGGSLTTPVAEGESVFVLSRMSRLMCLDRTDGKVRWDVDLAGKYGIERGFFGLCATPLVLEEGLLINVGKAMLFDKRSGNLLWTTEDYGYSYSTPVSFEQSGDPLLAVFNAKGLAVLERDGGAERALFPWTSNYNVNCASPIVMGDRVFISTGFDDKGCAMLELKGDKLERIWESKAMRSKMTGAVLWDDVLYGFDANLFKALTPEGETLWKERGLGNGAFRLCRDGRALLLTEEGELLTARVGPRGFEELSRRRLFDGGKCWTSPVISGGLVFCRGSRGRLVCLDQRSTPMAPSSDESR